MSDKSLEDARSNDGIAALEQANKELREMHEHDKGKIKEMIQENGELRDIVIPNLKRQVASCPGCAAAREGLRDIGSRTEDTSAAWVDDEDLQFAGWVRSCVEDTLAQMDAAKGGR